MKGIPTNSECLESSLSSHITSLRRYYNNVWKKKDPENIISLDDDIDGLLIGWKPIPFYEEDQEYSNNHNNENRHKNGDEEKEVRACHSLRKWIYTFAYLFHKFNDQKLSKEKKVLEEWVLIIVFHIFDIIFSETTAKIITKIMKQILDN